MRLEVWKGRCREGWHGTRCGCTYTITYRAVSVTAALGSFTAVDGVCTRRPRQSFYLAWLPDAGQGVPVWWCLGELLHDCCRRLTKLQLELLRARDCSSIKQDRSWVVIRREASPWQTDGDEDSQDRLRLSGCGRPRKPRPGIVLNHRQPLLSSGDLGLASLLGGYGQALEEAMPIKARYLSRSRCDSG